MQNKSPTDELKNAIQLLEVEQAANWQLLKEQFHLTYESLKPVNLLKSTVHDIASSPYLIDNIISNSLGLATGYLSRKIIVGASGNKFRKFIGFVLQCGVANFVAQRPEAIKSIGQFILQHVFRKKELNSEKP